MITRILEWLKHPYQVDMDAAHWFYFLGLVLVVIFLWSRILHLITE